MEESIKELFIPADSGGVKYQYTRATLSQVLASPAAPLLSIQGCWNLEEEAQDALDDEIRDKIGPEEFGAYGQRITVFVVCPWLKTREGLDSSKSLELKPGERPEWDSDDTSLWVCPDEADEVYFSPWDTETEADRNKQRDEKLRREGEQRERMGHLQKAEDGGHTAPLLFSLIGLAIRCAPPGGLLFWAFFDPVVPTYIFVLVYLIYGGALLILDSALRPHPNPRDWRDDEIRVIKQFHLSLIFSRSAAVASEILDGMRWGSALWIVFLLWNSMWPVALLLGGFFFVTASISVRLDAFYFLDHAVKNGQLQYAPELAILERVRMKLLFARLDGL